jgi:hypothetical protein
MAIVLAAVLVIAASIWIAIRMEPGLGTPSTRARDSGPVRTARCRFLHEAPHPAVTRPVRCTQPVVVHGVRRRSGPAHAAGPLLRIDREAADLSETGQLFWPVSDPQQRAADRAVQHGLEHGVGRDRIQVPGGFVEQQDGPVGQHGPGHAEPLQVSTGDRMVPGREHRIQAMLEPTQPRAEPEFPEEVRYLPVRRVRRADAQVGAKRGGEQRRLLGTSGQQGPDLLGGQGPRVGAIDAQ